MGAFGPRRIVTTEDTHTPAAPYRLVDNEYSLLDASDLVFVDAPGTGFSRVMGKDKEKAFFGTDADAHAFSEFITQFLVKILTLEFAQISFRRKLRHAALGRRSSILGDGRQCGFQRRHPAVADPEL